MFESLKNPVTITMTAEAWAKVVAAIAVSRLDLHEKDELNSTIYDCVIRQDQVTLATA